MISLRASGRLWYRDELTDDIGPDEELGRLLRLDFAVFRPSCHSETTIEDVVTSKETGRRNNDEELLKDVEPKRVGLLGVKKATDEAANESAQVINTRG